jgi:hypothetical protein
LNDHETLKHGGISMMKQVFGFNHQEWFKQYCYLYFNRGFKDGDIWRFFPMDKSVGGIWGR